MNQTKFPLKLSAAICGAAMGMAAPAFAETNTSFSNLPLWGVGSSIVPHIALALSVEYPTAGPAYPHSGDMLDFWGTDNDMKTTYRGYFDSQKCYAYRDSGGYFEPVGYAKTADGVIGICNQSGQAGNGETFSGNFMNAVSMSALDIFRSAMTGGNRAYGTDNTTSNYTTGDMTTATYLRRANVVSSQNGTVFNDKLNLNSFSTNSLIQNSLGQFLPKTFIDSLKNNRYSGTPSLTNNGYQFRLSGGSDNSTWNKTLNIVVKVCTPGLLESNCVLKRNGNYKPEGLLQKYSRQGARFASLGYLSDNTNRYVAPSVLRSRMKQLNITETTNGITYGREWDDNTGIFVTNPDTTDAASSGVYNSGTINYLNKFGDANGYKQWDPAAELYYTALSYLRGNDRPGFGTGTLTSAPASTPYYRSSVTTDHKDGFPVIYNWDDPIKRGKTQAAWQCHASHIIFLGDTGTHADMTIPEFENVFTTDTVKPKTYLGYLLNNEGNPFPLGVLQNIGANTSSYPSGYSPAGMAGLAYWARVNDLRPSITGNQFGNNFMIDVVENNYRNGRNSYYLAAKYGGFTRLASNNVYEAPTTRNQWTDDPVGQSRISEFTDGVHATMLLPMTLTIWSKPWKKHSVKRQVLQMLCKLKWDQTAIIAVL